ncbi:MAG: methylmalonyl Co-A mutase-associated GTPase MeaB, partial [Polynucleobacter sp.]|nr:methylmalonyl Co-A mutase-associated GTPase MeaB [Polynucleobacter sp.]
LGLYLIVQGHRVAVLAIDPSSTVSGGSILGDKTRMEQLSISENAFIRPSPTAGNLGGVAEKTRETILLAEAAGFDVVIVETVGVGQSEIAVANMTDMFVLMHLPNAGDDLQAIKKGVMELADLVLINKADLDQAAARRAQSMIAHSLHLIGSFPSQGDMASKWQPQVFALSALKQEGIAQFWDLAKQFIAGQNKTGAFLGRRQKQASAWLTEHIEAGLKLKFREHTAIANQYPNTLEQVRSGQLAPSVAARQLLAIFHSNSEKVG